MLLSQDVYSSGLIDATAVAVDWMLHGRFQWLATERAPATFDFPAFVMNLRERPDRREHSRALLHAIGFTNLVFPDTISAADLSFDKVLAEGWMTENGLRGLDERVHLRPLRAKRAYVANTIGHLSAIRRGLESGHEVFAVFEDDLLPSACPLEVNRRLVHMLHVLTSGEARGEANARKTGREEDAAADLLYLEYCYEVCANVTAADRWMGWAEAPVCTGGIIYTRAGASRVLERCLPIFDGKLKLGGGVAAPDFALCERRCGRFRAWRRGLPPGGLHSYHAAAAKLSLASMSSLSCRTFTQMMRRRVHANH